MVHRVNSTVLVVCIVIYQLFRGSTIILNIPGNILTSIEKYEFSSNRRRWVVGNTPVLKITDSLETSLLRENEEYRREGWEDGKRRGSEMLKGKE